MSETICMSIGGRKWDEMSLDAALDACIDGAESRNVRPDGFEVQAGDMFATLENWTDPNGGRWHVLFTTTFCNDWSPWTSDSTHAELYRADDPGDVSQFHADVANWEAKPEYDPDYESYADDDDESTDG